MHLLPNHNPIHPSPAPKPISLLLLLLPIFFRLTQPLPHPTLPITPRSLRIALLILSSITSLLRLPRLRLIKARAIRLRRPLLLLLVPILHWLRLKVLSLRTRLWKGTGHQVCIRRHHRLLEVILRHHLLLRGCVCHADAWTRCAHRYAHYARRIH